LEDLAALHPGPEWGEELIRSAKIDYVVLEQGDLPGDWLKSRGQEVYANNSIRILFLHGGTKNP
jgi:hypothetical protein